MKKPFFDNVEMFDVDESELFYFREARKKTRSKSTSCLRFKISSSSDDDHSSSRISSRISLHGSSKYSQQKELFELLNRLQSARLDDQRCPLPCIKRAMKSSHDTLSGLESPYPLVFTTPDSPDWWSQSLPPPDPKSSISSPKEDPAICYRTYFLGTEHYNFGAKDETLGPILLSLKTVISEESEESYTRLLLRLNTETLHKIIPQSVLEEDFSPLLLAQLMIPELSVSALSPIITPKASTLILNYDEHVLVYQYKFGILYQREGQSREEDLFANSIPHSSSFSQFLSLVGQRIELSGHKGYRGGLDTNHGQTGEESIYEIHRGREIMFHVSSLLPYTPGDPQQLQRKRHIGNDILAIIFQEGDVSFNPSMISSHFLHAFIIVRPVGNKYRIVVTGRKDVYLSLLPFRSMEMEAPTLKDDLLDLFIQVETACYKSERFFKLEQRTRSTLLSNLEEELRERTNEFLKGKDSGPERRHSTSRLYESMKKALGSNRHGKIRQSKSTVNGGSLLSIKGIKNKGSESPISSPDLPMTRIPPPIESDDSSLNSLNEDEEIECSEENLKNKIEELMKKYKDVTCDYEREKNRGSLLEDELNSALGQIKYLKMSLNER